MFFPRYKDFQETVCFLVKASFTKNQLHFLKRNLDSNLKPKISAGHSVLRSQRLYKNRQVNKGLLKKYSNRFGKHSLIDGWRLRLSGKPPYLGTLFSFVAKLRNNTPLPLWSMKTPGAPPQKHNFQAPR